MAHYPLESNNKAPHPTMPGSGPYREIPLSNLAPPYLDYLSVWNIYLYSCYPSGYC